MNLQMVILPQWAHFNFLTNNNKNKMNKTIGYNLAGFFENKDPNVDADVKLLSKNSLVYERAPGGAIASKLNPYAFSAGWGINMDSINIVLPEGEVDEDGASREKWIEKMNDQPDHSYMDDMILRHKANPNLRLIWVANCLGCSTEDNISAIEYMVSNGVRITHVEFDNEAYGRGKYKDFFDYRDHFVGLNAFLQTSYPEIKRSICIAPLNKGVKDFEEWNALAAMNMNYFDCVSTHFYYTENKDDDNTVGLGAAFEEFPELTEPVDFQVGNEQLQKCFEALRNGLMQNGGWTDEIDGIKAMFPEKPILITEFNTKPAERFCNTLVNEAWIFMTFLQHDPAIEVLCVHNGNSPALYGRWTRVTKLDHNPFGDVQMRRLGFYAMQMISEIDSINTIPAIASPQTIMSAGKFCSYYANLTELPDEYIIATPIGLKVINPVINYVQGSRLYSSSGTTGWMPKNQPASYEIDGIEREAFTNHQLPAYSFGYISFEVVVDTPQEPAPKPTKPVGWLRKLLQKLFGMRKAGEYGMRISLPKIAQA